MERDEPIVRDLDPNDVAGVRQAAAVLAAALPNAWPTLTEATAEVWEALAPGRVCLAAWRGGALVGWVGGIPDYSHAWELHPLVVRADARGQGVGRALVAALEQRARAAGALTLYLGTDDDWAEPRTSVGGVDLWSDPLAQAAALEPGSHPAGFYRRVGFAVVGVLPDANGPGKPDIWMAKRLGPAPADGNPPPSG
ncbi:MAG TPA: GNAT family N-acetyltransferase [Thermomicrobiales bacterium]|nr:GNAT family N-acetyltransferase [Thermomicrobiales bacterium]